jgi:hypothetical protein
VSLFQYIRKLWEVLPDPFPCRIPRNPTQRGGIAQGKPLPNLVSYLPSLGEIVSGRLALLHVLQLVGFDIHQELSVIQKKGLSKLVTELPNKKE